MYLLLAIQLFFARIRHCAEFTERENLLPLSRSLLFEEDRAATVRAVLKHEGINSETSATMEEFMGSES